MKEAMFFEKRDTDRVKCFLCPLECVISEGKSGVCGARQNVGGELFSRNYGVVSSASMDPVEKKPLYHYYPGEMILSLGTVGCNLKCQFCQNNGISRYYDNEFSMPTEVFTPQSVIRAVNESGSFGVAYTYSEPVVWYEFVYDAGKIVAESGAKNVLVTNGFINPEPLKNLIPLIHAANIDLKAFSEENYRRLGGKLAPVLDTITAMKDAGIHIEITTLVVTGLNDNLDELGALIKWIADLDKNIPYHISRYFPHYHYNEVATDLEFLNEVVDLAKTHLNYVYLGNTVADNTTYCPGCGNPLIQRHGYSTSMPGLKTDNGKAVCAKCGRSADIIAGKVIK
jgi:pyruvate formate lyase activating enzyme